MSFSTKELIDMAIEIEESGYSFYRKCREKFDDEELRDLFSFLAEEELRHKDIFGNLLSEIKDGQGVFTDEYYLYLKALGEERVFRNSGDVDRVVRDVQSPLDAVRIAMTAERDSIIWYGELKEIHGKVREAVAILARILDEERRHVATLFDLREKLILKG